MESISAAGSHKNKVLLASNIQPHPSRRLPLLKELSVVYPTTKVPDTKHWPTCPPPDRASSWEEAALSLERDGDPRSKERQADRPFDIVKNGLST